MFERPLIVHTQEHVVAAFCAANSFGGSLILQSSPDAIFYAGMTYLKKMVDDVARDYPNVRFSFILDCGDDASLALQAIRSGFQILRTNLAPLTDDKINEAARQFSIKCLNRKFHALDLAQVKDVRAACLEWLAEVAA